MKKEERAEQIKALVARGMSGAAIAKEFGISRQRVAVIMSEFGIAKAPRVKKVKTYKRKGALERLFSRREIQPNGCWNYTGCVAPTGYGRISFNGESSYVHRTMFLLMGGDPELWVLHNCDNPKCFNPEHLRGGTAKENSADRDARTPREKWNPVFTKEKAVEALELYRSGETTQTALAKKFGVQFTVINRALTRLTRQTK